jgi:hypothetical protein
MAKREPNPDLLARKTFLITVVGAVLYISVVFAFVIGGNRREEAQDQRDQAEQAVDAAHASPAESEHHP